MGNNTLHLSIVVSRCGGKEDFMRTEHLSSWPPTSDNPNLHVVDGTQPAAVNSGVAKIQPVASLIGELQRSTATSSMPSSPSECFKMILVMLIKAMGSFNMMPMDIAEDGSYVRLWMSKVFLL